MNDIPIRFSRTALLLGENPTAALTNKKVLVVGVGGVGGHAVENIVRAGIGSITLVDGDNVDISNCNRQIIALASTVGLPKTEVLAARCREINPDGDFRTINRFLKSPEDIAELLDSGFDYVIDAIDDVPVKVELIRQLKQRDIPFISSMGAGGKTDPSLVQQADLSKSHGCPLARVMRSRLKPYHLKNIPVIFSPEIPLRRFEDKKIGSISYMPAIFGCFCAAAAIRKLLSK
jgi:tRNA A37 threonylcarbamoyladenosine dehydratase